MKAQILHEIKINHLSINSWFTETLSVIMLTLVKTIARNGKPKYLGVEFHNVLIADRIRPFIDRCRRPIAADLKLNYASLRSEC